MRGDEKRDAVDGEFEEEVPELAAGDRIDEGSGLVEQQELRFVQHGAAEWQTLLPSAGKLRSEPAEVRAEAIELDDFVHASLQTLGRQTVDAAVELNIFHHHHIFVATESL